MDKRILRLDHIVKSFGSFRAVDDLCLDIGQGEIFALLGPSGCGKSTTLRQIAGLDQPDSGEILLHDRPLFSSSANVFVPAQKRNMGMVFQSYAIWPHLTVFETVAYPLQVRNQSQAQIREAVMATIRLVGLEGVENRPAPMLSGGQQQRVALARALVYKPDVLLLDEPFSNLDKQLREQMRGELKLLQRRVGVTVILVTHDQEEALSMSDRIAVMNAGKVEQVGTPLELYEQPATPFVRDFIGHTTRISAKVSQVLDGAAEISIGDASVLLRSTSPASLDHIGRPVLACIRPEHIRVGSAAAGADNVVEGTVETLLFLGDRYECWLRIGNEVVVAYAARRERLSEGQRVPVQFPREDLSLWPN
jgi:ABC-type Fe3+/spermidine/putrescine transport system ATPase subunit